MDALFIYEVIVDDVICVVIAHNKDRVRDLLCLYENEEIEIEKLGVVTDDVRETQSPRVVATEA